MVLDLTPSFLGLDLQNKLSLELSADYGIDLQKRQFNYIRLNLEKERMELRALKGLNEADAMKKILIEGDSVSEV